MERLRAVVDLIQVALISKLVPRSSILDDKQPLDSLERGEEGDQYPLLRGILRMK